MKNYFITGVIHGSIMHCKSHTKALRAFSICYGGEFILYLKSYSGFIYP